MISPAPRKALFARAVLAWICGLCAYLSGQAVADSFQLEPETTGEANLATVIRLHSDARGGEAAIEDIRSLRLDLEITEAGFTVRGDYTATREGFMRIDIFAGDERVFTEALGPEGGWQLLQGETVPVGLSEEGESALRRGLAGNLYGLHERPGLGYELFFAQTVTRRGEEYWGIDQVAPDGFSKRLFVDKSSFLVVREMETSALHPDLDQTKTQQETLFSDYSVSAGVLTAHRTTKIDATTQKVVQTVVVRSVRVNPDIDIVRFLPPG